MIKIFKGSAPGELVARGAYLTNILLQSFDLSPAEYSNGTKTFDFDHGCYASPTVKSTLRILQHNKCCFSEAQFRGDFSHVEHFRPKGRVDEIPTKVKLYPGYYWLAYTWSNLFLCKELINVSYKRNLFPLEDSNLRNRCHHDQNSEGALFIDPYIDDPRQHIQFHKDEPFALTARGQITIQYLGLRHPEFEEGRRKLFDLLQTMKDVVDLAIAKGIDANNPAIFAVIMTLRGSIAQSAEYSSMAIDFLTGWPLLQ